MLFDNLKHEKITIFFGLYLSWINILNASFTLRSATVENSVYGSLSGQMELLLLQDFSQS